MKLRDFQVKMLSKVPFLYKAYAASRMKDVINGTLRTRRELKTNNLVVIEKFKMKLDYDSYMDLSLYKQILETGFYEEEVTKFIKRFLKSGDTFVDVGANSGFYTLLASRIVGEKGEVYSFEPDPKNFQRLKENIMLNHAKNVGALNLAISSFEGQSTLNLSLSSDGLNSLTNIPLSDKSITVSVKSIDSLFADKKVDMIKMDAEGSELDIIKGSCKVLEKNRNIKLVYEVGSDSYYQITSNLIKMGISSFLVDKNCDLIKLPEESKDIPHGVRNLVALRVI